MPDLDWLQDMGARRQIAFALEEVPEDQNRETVLRYLKERHVNGIQDKTLINHIQALRDLAKDLGETPFEDASKADIVDHFADPSRVRRWRIPTEDDYQVVEREVTLSHNTLAVRKQIVRRFYKWVYDTDTYPSPVSDLEPNRRNPDAIPTDELISREDLQDLIKAHHHPRDKAMLAVLYESGLRAGEFVALNIRNVEFDEYGARITLPKDAAGLKTGARMVRLVDSAPYLQSWYEAHPDKDNPDAPLFISLSTKNEGERLTTNALYYFCTRAGERAELDMKTNPHLFRHSSATEKARQGWTEAEMRAYFGWSRTSDQPARYNHLAGRDYEDMMLERMGVKDEDEEEARALAPRVCPSCKAENLPSSNFCQECRSPISPEAEEELEERRRQEMEEMVAKKVEEKVREHLAGDIQDAVENADI